MQFIITHAVYEECHAASIPLSWNVDYGSPLLKLDLDNTLGHQFGQ